MSSVVPFRRSMSDHVVVDTNDPDLPDWRNQPVWHVRWFPKSGDPETVSHGQTYLEAMATASTFAPDRDADLFVRMEP